MCEFLRCQGAVGSAVTECVTDPAPPLTPTTLMKTPTELEIEVENRLWAAAEIVASDVNEDVVKEIVWAFFRGENIQECLEAYLGESLYGLSLKSPQVINETLAEKRM